MSEYIVACELIDTESLQVILTFFAFTSALAPIRSSATCKRPLIEAKMSEVFPCKYKSKCTLNVAFSHRMIQHSTHSFIIATSHTKYKHAINREMHVHYIKMTRGEGAQLASSSYESSCNQIYSVQGLLTELRSTSWVTSVSNASKLRAV